MSETKRKKLRVRTVTTLLLIALVLPAYFIGDGTILKLLLVLGMTIGLIEYTTCVRFAASAEEEMLREFRHATRAPNFLRDRHTSQLVRHNHIFWPRRILSSIFVAALFLGCIAPILLSNYRKEWLGFGIITAVMTDIGSYLFGFVFGHRIFRKARPFPRLSPNKTFEGLIGGYMAGVLSAALWLKNVMPDSSLWQNARWIIYILPVLAILGDLSESAMKRFFGVKDANDHMPLEYETVEALLGGKDGHGGYLDRLDSLTFILLFIALYLSCHLY